MSENKAARSSKYVWGDGEVTITFPNKIDADKMAEETEPKQESSTNSNFKKQVDKLIETD